MVLKNPHHPPVERLLKVSEAGQRLGISRAKLFRLLADKSLPSVRIGLRSTRIPESALLAYMAALPSAREE